MIIVESAPLSANVKLIAGKDVVQSFNKINPNISQSQLDVIRNFVNVVRRSNQQVTGGLFTITDEIKRV